MNQCKAIGCDNTISHPYYDPDYCLPCSNAAVEREPIKPKSSGSDNDYWLVEVPGPKRLDPYTAECEDIIEALEMTFQEGEAFKAIWRKCADRLGNGKPGDTPLRNAEKVSHFGRRMVAMEQRKLECTSHTN